MRWLDCQNPAAMRLSSGTAWGFLKKKGLCQPSRRGARTPLTTCPFSQQVLSIRAWDRLSCAPCPSWDGGQLKAARCTFNLSALEGHGWWPHVTVYKQRVTANSGESVNPSPSLSICPRDLGWKHPWVEAAAGTTEARWYCRQNHTEEPGRK